MEEKRKHKRIYFSFDEDFSVEIEHSFPFKGKLLSLSEGGISFFSSIDKAGNLKKEDIIFLNCLKNEQGIPFINSKVSLSVRYVITDKEADKIIVGCKFLDLPEQSRSLIRELVERKNREFSI